MNLSIFSIVIASETYDSSERRDPFIPLVTGEKTVVRGLYGVETLADVNIEGIVHDAKNGSVAIINGEIVREGETRENLKVLKVQPNGVLLELNEIQEFKSFGEDDPQIS